MSDVQIEILDDIENLLKKYQDVLNLTDFDCRDFPMHILDHILFLKGGLQHE